MGCVPAEPTSVSLDERRISRGKAFEHLSHAKTITGVWGLAPKPRKRYTKTIGQSCLKFVGIFRTRDAESSLVKLAPISMIRVFGMCRDGFSNAKSASEPFRIKKSQELWRRSETGRRGNKGEGYRIGQETQWRPKYRRGPAHVAQ